MDFPSTEIWKNIASVPNVSIRGLGRFLKRSHKGVFKEMQEAELQAHTPYGPLITEVELEFSNGPPQKWPIVNPFALLYVLCSVCPLYLNFARRCIGEDMGNIILYTDETTPGNQLHVDQQRELCCFYWTFAQFPKWFRARASGWLILGFIKTTELKHVKGGLSGLCAQVLRVFWSPKSFNFLFGMRLPIQGGHWHLRAKLLCFVQDGLADKKVCSVKGASGIKVCIACKNIVQCDPKAVKDDKWRVHYALAKPHQFDRHTPATFFEMVDKLAQAHGTIPKGLFEKLEKECGINYDPHSILCDQYARAIFNPIDHIYKDPMHVFLASKGVAQYEVNCFVAHLVKVERCMGTHRPVWMRWGGESGVLLAYG